MRITFLLLLTVLFSACRQSTNQTRLLNGNDWQMEELDAQNWQLAQVPGSVQSDLLRLGKIPDPFLLNNQDSIQWISEKNWRYKKSFTISPSLLKTKQHILKFDGLDTYAKVVLNGHLILQTNNAFSPYEFNVTEILQIQNTLVVTLYSPDAIEAKAALNLGYTLPEGPRVFSRKPQFQYGWDWGPKIKTMGIWRDVSLISYSDARLEDVFIQTQEITTSQALLKANIAVMSFVADTGCVIEVINNTTGEIHSQGILLDRGTKNYSIGFSIKKPKLWWTHNLGTPFLYDFTIHLKKGNTILETLHKKVGLRTIQLVTEKDTLGERFYFKLNGKPIYMKGANYIPQNIFLSQVRPQEREKLLNDALKANMNMLRVWGGGVYEDDLFYDLCDEKGILVWQDFMFACAMYPGDKEFLDNVKKEAITNVKRLRQHPSIALYCGNNENSEGWQRWGWQAGKTQAQKQEIWNSYQAVFNDILPKVVDSLHASISYWESSPKFGRGDKRYQFQGDAHDWWVWHDGYPFEHFEQAVPRFMSEFGFQSYPGYKAIKYFTQEDSIDLSHPSFESHQKHSRGFEIIKRYMKRDFPVPTNAEDYIYVSQLLQAYGITKGIKAHRAAKPYNMGTLYWQLNDCWPAVSWSSIDGLGNWKALHYKVKQAFENRIIVPFKQNNLLKIKVVDDGPITLGEPMQVLFYDFNGNILHQTPTKSVRTFNEKNQVVYQVDLREIEFDPKQTYAKVLFGDIQEVYYFEKPKDLNLPMEGFDMKTKIVSQGIEISLKATTLQKNVFLYTDTPGHFTDNFFDLLPGEQKNIIFVTKEPLSKPLQYKTLNALQP